MANAGPDQSVNENTPVTLDGSASTDPDNDPLIYEWTQIAGLSVVLTDPASATPAFTAPQVPRGGATLTLQLIVNDGELSSDPDTVDITVTNVNHAPVALAGDDQTVAEDDLNHPPTANAGADQTNPEGTAAGLNGTASSDPDADVLTYAWQ